VNPSESWLGNPRCAQALQSVGVRFARAERSDIETLRRERRGNARIVDSRLMGEQNHRGVKVGAEARQNLLRPFGDHLAIGEPFERRKGGARIYDDEIEAGELCHRRQSLRDVSRAEDDEANRRHFH